MAGHGLMWSNIYQPEKPKVKRRVDWRRLGALFAPYWRQQATVLACIVTVSALGLVPGFVVAHIIDETIPHRNLGELGIDVGVILASALLSAGIGVLQGYPQLRRRRRHHARHPHESRRASPPHAARFLHRHEDRRNHEPGQ